MTSIFPNRVERVRRRVDAARAQYQNISDMLEAAIQEKIAARDGGMSDILNALNTHWKALNSLNEKEAGLDELIRTQAGLVEGYAIDLDAARTEIGRRLACLKTSTSD